MMTSHRVLQHREVTSQEKTESHKEGRNTLDIYILEILEIYQIRGHSKGSKHKERRVVYHEIWEKALNCSFLMMRQETTRKLVFRGLRTDRGVKKQDKTRRRSPVAPGLVSAPTCSRLSVTPMSCEGHAPCLGLAWAGPCDTLETLQPVLSFSVQRCSRIPIN